MGVCISLVLYLSGWTQVFRVMLGETSSYLRGEDTSKLVTPSDACWVRQNHESEKENTFGRKTGPTTQRSVFLLWYSFVFRPLDLFPYFVTLQPYSNMIKLAPTVQ